MNNALFMEEYDPAPNSHTLLMCATVYVGPKNFMLSEGQGAELTFCDSSYEMLSNLQD